MIMLSACKEIAEMKSDNVVEVTALVRLVSVVCADSATLLTE